jgi:hypothetical protein
VGGAHTSVRGSTRSAVLRNDPSDNKVGWGVFGPLGRGKAGSGKGDVGQHRHNFVSSLFFFYFQFQLNFKFMFDLQISKCPNYY